jgi:hypothetical protein
MTDPASLAKSYMAPSHELVIAGTIKVGLFTSRRLLPAIATTESE